MTLVLLRHRNYIDVPLRAPELLTLCTRLQNRIAHLVRSNAELVEALAEAPNDADFADAVAENKECIAIMELRIRELHELCCALDAAAACKRPVAFVPDDDWVSATGDEGVNRVVVGLTIPVSDSSSLPLAAHASVGLRDGAISFTAQHSGIDASGGMSL